MKIYNTKTKKIEQFVPKNKEEVKMYTCGPTVYHFAHIGNLRSYIFEDILEKGLNFVGYKVDRCMNITDVGHLSSDGDTGEDKMLKGALRENKTVYEIAQFYTDAFFKDCEKLNIKKPDIIAKASDEIDMYIKMIKKLIETNHAYISNNNVYFDISKIDNYYELSGKNKEDLLIGAREDVNEDIHKKNPADFGLWFTTSKFENQAMKWDSPWGVGYPGWHIECSGISIKYLGEYIDIHCGGVDNIFPHHSNEIAQSEAYLGHEWCSYWMHGEHLNDINGKMSKSKGEFLTLTLLEEKGFNPLAYRFMCLQSHYRKQLIFTLDSLQIAENIYKKTKNKILSLISDDNINEDIKNDYINKFKKAIENDLNTSLMITCLFDILKEQTTDSTKIAVIKEYDKVLSLDLFKKEEINEDLKTIIEEKIKQRNNYKSNKQYDKADEIRIELEQMNIKIKDTREGTTYEVM